MCESKRGGSPWWRSNSLWHPIPQSCNPSSALFLCLPVGPFGFGDRKRNLPLEVAYSSPGGVKQMSHSPCRGSKWILLTRRYLQARQAPRVCLANLSGICALYSVLTFSAALIKTDHRKPLFSLNYGYFCIQVGYPLILQVASTIDLHGQWW